jgi:hypothetical protein
MGQIKKTRLERKREKESLVQAIRYLALILVLLVLAVRFGLPALIRMAGFLADIKSESEPIEKTDTLAPAPPTLYPIPEATNSARLDLNGFSEAGATVELFVRGISIKETVADTEGEFKFSDIHLSSGENEIYVQAKDAAGNQSQASKSWQIILDQEAPSLSINEPEDGQRFFDVDSSIMVKVITEPEVNLSLNGRLMFVNDEGEAETKLDLAEGDNQLELVARDAAGNESRKTITVNYSP